MTQSVKVNVCGKVYSLMTEETPSYVQNLGRKLEEMINDVSGKTGSSTFYSAVMVALMLMDSLDKSNKNIDSLRNQVKGHVHEAGKAKLEKDNALREVDLLKAELDSFENSQKLKELANSI